MRNSRWLKLIWVLSLAKARVIISVSCKSPDAKSSESTSVVHQVCADHGLKGIVWDAIIEWSSANGCDNVGTRVEELGEELNSMQSSLRTLLRRLAPLTHLLGQYYLHNWMPKKLTKCNLWFSFSKMFDFEWKKKKKLSSVIYVHSTALQIVG